MYKFFLSVNKLEFHNKSIHSDLELEQYWVTQCGWIRLHTAVAMGMTIANFRKLFHYGVNREHY